MKRKIKGSLLVGLFLSATLTFSSCTKSDPIPNANDWTSQINNLPAESLNVEEISNMIFMREEEKLARDVYAVLYSKWGVNIFSNIGDSEQKHMDAVLKLLDKYNLLDPVGANGMGIFTNSQLQVLYNQLVDQGSISMADALKVGATIEDLDILDLKTALTKTDNQDIKLVYENLSMGSRNHLRSFYSNILVSGETYDPQFITQEEFDSIINNPMEKGIRGN